MSHLSKAIVRLAMCNRKFTWFIEFIEFLGFFNSRNWVNSRNPITPKNLIALCFMLIAFILAWGNIAYARVELKINEPALCYECHKDLKERLSDSYTHPLFKQGKCSPCHDPHVSNIKGLLREEINSICLSCHEELRNLLKKGTLHTTLKKGKCIDCHRPHSGENKYLLVKSEKNLCMDCHKDIEGQLKKPYSCLPFKEGKCSSCHNSHASTEDNLLIAKPNELCKKCHGPLCKVGKVSIVSVVKERDCTTCHTGHSSQDKGLLGPYGHTVFLKKECEQCHNPIVAERKITTKIEGKESCLSCHKRDIPTKYIENDIHVKDAKNPCNVCHDYHASDKKNLTKKELRLCMTCHEDTEKRTALMERTLKTIKCSPIKDRKCFECHMIKCSSQRPFYYTGDSTFMCNRCHETQHKTTHPIGPNVIDIRTGQPMTCISCHRMHSSRAEFMLTHERSRALCIQCHKM